MKTVFITGVGSGIGKATSIKFLKEGFRVIGVLKNDSHLKSLLESTINLSGCLEVIYANLENESFVSDVQLQITELNITELSALINVAGILDTTSFPDFALTRLETVMRINFSNPSMLISRLFPLLQKGHGTILNITSMSGFQGSVRFPGLSIYGASKAALSSLSESLACEFENVGVHINALAIGAVNTQMLRNAFPDFEATISVSDMADYIFNFATQGYKFHNGKTISVAITNP